MNELQNRLEYLVSYSSQLIFVGSDSAAQQQNASQKFLSSQHENVDIAYLTAPPDFANTECRAQIYQQLLNETGFSQSPLNAHLIKSLPQQSGPVLICICSAQHLSELIINELWDLVIQNKEHTNGHHLNVLLFGDASWTHEAKIMLSEKDAHIPILLSTETVSSGATPLSLDDSISHNRERIQKKMLAHATSQASENEPSNSVIHQAWFKLVSIALFLILFGAILFWQYPQEISRFLQPTYANLPQPVDEYEKSQENEEASQVAVKEDLEAEGVAASVNDRVLAESHNQASSFSNGDEVNPQSEIVLEDTAKVSDPAEVLQASTDLQTSAQQSGSLVTDWQTEVDKIKQAESKTKAQLAVTETDLPVQPEPNPIFALEADRYVLQLGAMSDVAIRDDYIAQHGLQNTSWTYKTQRFGGDWHVIVFAQSFDSIAQARNYISSLPDTIDKSQPFAKSGQQIKQELSASSNTQ